MGEETHSRGRGEKTLTEGKREEGREERGGGVDTLTQRGREGKGGREED